MTAESIEISINEAPAEKISTVFGSDESVSVIQSESERNPTPETGLRIKDHFSLDQPSSTAVFQNKKIKIFSQQNGQLTLEESDEALTAKIMADGSSGLTFLRVSYSLVAVLMSGFLLVACLQVILFLFLGIATDSGLTSNQGWDVPGFIGTLLSIPVFSLGLAQCMTIATSFVVDTYYGHHFIKSMAAWKSVMIDWIAFFVYLIIPILVGALSLFAGSEHWWTITALTWFSSVGCCFVVFALSVVYYEVDGCLQLLQNHPKIRASLDDGETISWLDKIKRSILLRQKEKLSGLTTVIYVEENENNDEPKFSDLKNKKNYDSKTGLFSRITTWQFLGKIGLYTKPDEPIRLYAMDEVREQNPFITAETWNLEKLFCRSRESRSVVVVKGPNAITTDQARSSVICALLGNLIGLLVFISLLVWLEMPGLFIGIVCILVIICSLKSILNTINLYKTYQELHEHKESEPNDSEEIWYKVKANYRINEATDKFCMVLFLLEFIFFFIVPIIVLFSVGNIRIAGLFVFVGVITVCREYINLSSVLMEFGTLDGLEIDNKSGTPYEDWREKHRLSLIAGKISQGRSRDFWLTVFYIFIFLFCLIFMAAVIFGANDGSTEEFEFLKDFYYEGNSGMPYPTCRLGMGFKTPAETESALVDYVFLSSLAYQAPIVTQSALDDWFGENVGRDRQDIVDNFRATYEKENGASSVQYKLIEFNETSIVAIRGTVNGWDALTDAQLWSGAALAQYVRALLPVGEIWTPILTYLVKAVTSVQSSSLEKVAFYKQTTAFVQNLISEEGLNPLITGHSLGGGLSMITGAQTGSPAVALSGPNNKISRLSFEPPLEIDALDRLTFNIIPDRDPVPRIDDPARLYQRIQCTAPVNNPVDCHSSLRSLCEVLVQCGSANRPVVCFCHNVYDYPKPKPSGSRTFEEACPAVIN